MIAAFLQHLVEAIDLDEPGWQEDTVFLLDNASYHASAETMRVFNRLGLQVMFSGPYSYSAAPIETLFSALKCTELNLESVPTGKR